MPRIKAIARQHTKDELMKKNMFMYHLHCDITYNHRVPDAPEEWKETQIPSWTYNEFESCFY